MAHKIASNGRGEKQISDDTHAAHNTAPSDQQQSNRTKKENTHKQNQE
jgi:hypothetical protein